MRQIMVDLSSSGHTVFRANVGLFFTKDGRPVKSGLPTGFSDIFGFTREGKPFFIEVKTSTGRLSTEQTAFIAAMRARGAIAGMVRSSKEALELLVK